MVQKNMNSTPGYAHCAFFIKFTERAKLKGTACIFEISALQKMDKSRDVESEIAISPNFT